MGHLAVVERLLQNERVDPSDVNNAANMHQRVVTWQLLTERTHSTFTGTKAGLSLYYAALVSSKKS